MGINRWSLAKLGAAKTTRVVKRRTGWKRATLLVVWGLVAAFGGIFGVAIVTGVVLMACIGMIGTRIGRFRQRPVQAYADEVHSNTSRGMDRLRWAQREIEWRDREIERLRNEGKDA
jgi:hypothetical protein